MGFKRILPENQKPNWKEADEVSAMIPIPIYEQAMMLVVTKDVMQAQMTRREELNLNPSEDAKAVFCYHHYKFCLILGLDSITHQTIAHEVFHATHRILDFVTGVKMHIEHQEPHAYLHGYLTRKIYERLRAWGVKIK